MSLRDDVRRVLGSGVLVKTMDELMEIIERAIAAERVNVTLKDFLETASGQVMLLSLRVIGVEFFCDEGGPGWNNIRVKAERAATVEECKATIGEWAQPAAWNAIDKLPRDRSALDAMLAEARAEGERAMFEQFWDLAACCYGAPAGKHSPASLLDALVDQARAEGARWAVQAAWNRGFNEGMADGAPFPSETEIEELSAAAIRAQGEQP